MAAVVGGRIEVVARSRSLFGPDYLALAALAAVSLAVHAWLVAHTSVPARDSIGFARYALQLQTPEATVIPPDKTRSWVDVVKQAEQPPGYPAACWLTAKAVRRLTPLPLPDSTLLATQLTSAFAALVLVVPGYLLGRMLFGRFVGFAGALLLQVLPVPARVTSDGLSEGLYLLVVGTAVVLGVRAVRRPGVGGFLLCGLATGAGYLVRPEGLMVGAAFGGVTAWLGLTRKWPRDLTAGRLAALAVGVALVAVPYMTLIGKLTAKPTGNQILHPTDGPGPAMFRGGPTSQANPVGGGPVFAEWWGSTGDSAPSRAVWAAEAVGKETGKGLHYLTGLFALAGLYAQRRRVTTEPALWALGLLAALNLAVLVYLAARIGYVSERHTVLLVMLGCVAAAAALEPVAGKLAGLPKVGRLWAGRAAPAGLLALLVVSTIPSTFKPMHPQREGHKHAGRFLKAVDDEWLRVNDGRTPDRLDPRPAVIDPFCWADWYAWRTLYLVPPDPPHPRIVYAVVENSKSPHSRLPRLADAENVRRDGRAVPAYWWPENVPPESAEVVVYRLERPEGK